MICLLSAWKRDVALSVPKPNLEPLYGTWQWVMSSGGFTGALITPASAGYSYAMQFDNQGGFTEIKNGKSIDKIYYVLTKDSTYRPQEPGYYIQFILHGSKKNDTYNSKQYLSFISQDTLLMAQMVDDGYVSIYVRK